MGIKSIAEPAERIVSHTAYATSKVTASDTAIAATVPRRVQRPGIEHLLGQLFKEWG